MRTFAVTAIGECIRSECTRTRTGPRQFIGAPDSARNRAARTTAGVLGAASAVKVARHRRARVYDHLRDAVNRAAIIPFRDGFETGTYLIPEHGARRAI